VIFKGVYNLLTGKQRSYLKGLGNNIEPIFQLGKNGLSENFTKQVEEALEARELIKIKILQNCSLEAKEVGIQLAEETGAELVQSIGSKFILYRESKDNKRIELPK
jgi:RNA-binding protein